MGNLITEPGANTSWETDLSIPNQTGNNNNSLGSLLAGLLTSSLKPAAVDIPPPQAKTTDYGSYIALVIMVVLLFGGLYALTKIK